MASGIAGASLFIMDADEKAPPDRWQGFVVGR
jgi:hypothetical protein